MFRAATDNPSAPPDVASRWALPWWWTWGVGLLVGLVVLGPGLGGGSLLSLDLLVTPEIPIPNGVFGLGPALSQRVPLFALLGAGSWLVGGPVAAKVAIVALVAAAFAGAARLAGPSSGIATQAAAGLLWAAGPFALTRLGAGHLNLVWAIGVLPWALPRLCRPSEQPWRTFLAAGLVAFGGPGAGTLGLAAVVVALVVERSRRPMALVAALGANLVWALPTAVLLWAGAGVQGSGGFVTQGITWTGWPGLLAGDGFWRADYQVGATGWGGTATGLAVGGLAVLGWRAIDEPWWRGARAAAVVGLGLAAATAVPGVRVVYDWASDLPVGAPLRESQRFATLWLVWAAPAAALGAARLARLVGDRLAPVVLAVPLAVVLAISVPGWWGIHGRLVPVEFPSGWAAARAEIDRHPGTVLALPWSEYPLLSFAAGRGVFNPLPDYLGGDVLSSYDPGFDRSVVSQEQVDRRSLPADALAERVLAGIPVADDLATLGVRWVVLPHEQDWADHQPGLLRDPGLRRALALPDLDLYEVVGWRGPALAPDGSAHRLDRPLPPLLTTDAPTGSVLSVAGAPGWVQGWATPVAVTADGRLRLEGEGGIVWFWPTAALAAADLGLLGVVVLAVRRRRGAVGRLRPGPSGEA